MIAHFFLYTGWGSVVMVTVASAAVALVGYAAVAVIMGLIARELWRLWRTLTR